MMKNTRFSGINLLEALLIAFVVLRLVGVIDWSWWWVLSPIWIPAIAVIVGAYVVGMIKKARTDKTD
jgi:hypothetical protein